MELITYQTLIKALKGVAKDRFIMVKHPVNADYISYVPPSWHFMRVRDTDGMRAQLVISNHGSTGSTVGGFLSKQDALVTALCYTKVQDDPLDYPMYYWRTDEMNIHNVAAKKNPELTRLGAVTDIEVDKSDTPIYLHIHPIVTPEVHVMKW